jgi:hypothetical protein
VQVQKFDSIRNENIQDTIASGIRSVPFDDNKAFSGYSLRWVPKVVDKRNIRVPSWFIVMSKRVSAVRN